MQCHVQLELTLLFHYFTNTHAELQGWWGTKKMQQYNWKSNLKGKWQSIAIRIVINDNYKSLKSLSPLQQGHAK